MSILDRSFACDSYGCSAPSLSMSFRNLHVRLHEITKLRRNPRLGAEVRNFKNYYQDVYGYFNDATRDSDTTLVVAAAQNMKNLSDALLTPSHLAAHMIANLQSYIHLKRLQVYGLRPEDHIWRVAPVSLTNLRWKSPLMWSHDNPWQTATYLLNAVEKTCPALESLDIGVCDMRETFVELPKVPERAQDYRDAQMSPTARLRRLRHFGFQHNHYIEKQRKQELRVKFLEFVKKHEQSLVSVCPPADCLAKDLDFISDVSESLPGLKELTLTGEANLLRRRNTTGPAFFPILMTRITSLTDSIERASINIDCPFSAAVGKLFNAWPSLKFLRIGDAGNQGGPYSNSYGMLDVVAYAPVSESFVSATNGLSNTI